MFSHHKFPSDQQVCILGLISPWSYRAVCSTASQTDPLPRTTGVSLMPPAYTYPHQITGPFAFYHNKWYQSSCYMAFYSTSFSASSQFQVLPVLTLHLWAPFCQSPTTTTLFQATNISAQMPTVDSQPIPLPSVSQHPTSQSYPVAQVSFPIHKSDYTKFQELPLNSQ